MFVLLLFVVEGTIPILLSLGPGGKIICKQPYPDFECFSVLLAVKLTSIPVISYTSVVMNSRLDNSLIRIVLGAGILPSGLLFR